MKDGYKQSIVSALVMGGEEPEGKSYSLGYMLMEHYVEKHLYTILNVLL